jgi:hypothetical protein
MMIPSEPEQDLCCQRLFWCEKSLVMTARMKTWHDLLLSTAVIET